ncbi:DUF4085 family protein [Chengkuizengella sediminis]|uniref:DUF4085 family protein n=1 Tax=Chengkuizengella sediminis TaxID=1885917 RepID=UPI001389965C|nr:DUF4085 family protein [Chengkuizengella sediminis]NDI33204.1 DUF4085 family protein [Chengkuizengella sediminis]
MWNLSKKVKDRFLKSNLLPIQECDQDWEIALEEAKKEGENLTERLKAELEEVKDELLHVLPSRFIPYIENSTLNQPTLPKQVREDYLQWIRERHKEFEQILDAAYEQTKWGVTYLPTTVQEVFAESLHDSTIQRIERQNNTLHLYINTEGGFSSKSFVHFIFRNIISEETDEPIQVGQWLVYKELKKIDDGFSFRVLFECPDAEWTITMKEMDAQYYYRPIFYVTLRDENKIEETSFAEYVAQLNPAYHYWLITPDVKCYIKSFSRDIILGNGKIEFIQNKMVVTVGNQCFTYELNKYNPIEFIYTNVYEDPYAYFSKPVPTEQLEEAALSNEIKLKVRAWNTMHANPEELADIINHVLGKMKITEENEMMVSVFANHFYKAGILSKAVIEKYRTVID